MSDITNNIASFYNNVLKHEGNYTQAFIQGIKNYDANGNGKIDEAEVNKYVADYIANHSTENLTTDAAKSKIYDEIKGFSIGATDTAASGFNKILNNSHIYNENTIANFKRYDKDGDGTITDAEVSPKNSKNSYAHIKNLQAMGLIRDDDGVYDNSIRASFQTNEVHNTALNVLTCVMYEGDGKHFNLTGLIGSTKKTLIEAGYKAQDAQNIANDAVHKAKIIKDLYDIAKGLVENDTNIDATFIVDTMKNNFEAANLLTEAELTNIADIALGNKDLATELPRITSAGGDDDTKVDGDDDTKVDGDDDTKVNGGDDTKVGVKKTNNPVGPANATGAADATSGDAAEDVKPNPATVINGNPKLTTEYVSDLVQGVETYIENYSGDNLLTDLKTKIQGKSEVELTDEEQTAIAQLALVSSNAQTGAKAALVAHLSDEEISTITYNQAVEKADELGIHLDENVLEYIRDTEIANANAKVSAIPTIVSAIQDDVNTIVINNKDDATALSSAKAKVNTQVTTLGLDLSNSDREYIANIAISNTHTAASTDPTFANIVTNHLDGKFAQVPILGHVMNLHVLSKTLNGQAAISNCMTFNANNSVTITFPGYGKSYTFTSEQINAAGNSDNYRYSNDNDTALFQLAAESLENEMGGYSNVDIITAITGRPKTNLTLTGSGTDRINDLKGKVTTAFTNNLNSVVRLNRSDNNTLTIVSCTPTEVTYIDSNGNKKTCSWENIGEVERGGGITLNFSIDSIDVY